MIPEETFKANLEIAEQVIGIAGCVVECGVWRGGMSAGIAEILGPERDYYLFDSFEGLPPAGEIDGEAALRWQADKAGALYMNNCAATLDESLATMGRSPAVNVFPVKGWFQDTIPNCQLSSPVALLRLDGDWYDSTMTCLQTLFPRVVEGGKIIVDDYYAWDGCARAVHDYLSKNQLRERIEMLAPGVAFLSKRRYE